ncbi:related to short chain dehydrogenase/reductase family protein [Phialocephala subalpina]|uniref:Related to short chain dehydrogenase/reductase family protein n=1 Tax=Phialocephala subalpina TaxID=576137 RepID=A0A1L7XRR4_9HELO|nr:related to short chain dehydrogenase/reductase family protein [Phialocephala subalpina]
MSTAPNVILTTGSNRGIGFSIVQALGLRYPQNIYILACRSTSAGSEAIKELQKLGITAKLDVVELDIVNDPTIILAAKSVEEKYGRLDVLINNAAIGMRPKSDSLPDIRENFNTTFNANITSIMTTTTTFLPLLRKSQDPRIINVSSARGSITRSANGLLPTTAVVSYSVSKSALNSLTVELQRAEDSREDGGRVEFWVASPGHCKTAFNGYRGTKDPLDGAEVVVQLATAERGKWKKGGFWEFEEGGMREVPW